MKAEETRKGSPCPCFDELSAWHDGESRDAAIERHIHHCQSCQDVLHGLETIDLDIQQHVESIGPDGRTLERMMARTRLQLQPRKQQILSFPLLSRVAACAALLVIVFALMYHLNSLTEQDAAPAMAGPVEAGDEISPFEQELIDDLIQQYGSPDRVPSLDTASAPAQDGSLPGTSSAADALARTPGGRSLVTTPDGQAALDLSGISLVGYGTPSDSYGATRSQRTETNQPVRQLGDRVRHVWLVDDPADILRELQRLMPRHRQDFQELIQQERDHYVLQLVLPDRDLQELVDHLESLNFSLITPAPPQPGQGDELQLTGKAVQYELDFVRQ